MTPFLQPLLDASIRITAVALAVWLTLVIARIRSGSVRHAAWVAVLFAMPLMPVLSYVLPHIDVPVSSVAVTSEPIPVYMDSPVMAPSPTPSPELNSIPAPSTVPNPQTATLWIPSWPAIFLYIYAAVLIILLCRCVRGWLHMHRILRSSRTVLIGNTPVYQSSLISAPVTVGLKKQKILLPAEWSEWPQDKLRAVLAHESAHVERRDTVTGLLAHLNRCLFWFHPLAWWLERQLALAAEQACDDAGARALGENRKYAQVLLDMAEAVRRQGTLLSYVGAGVNGTGLLGLRIDRLLRENPFSKISRTRKALVALSCAAAIFLAAACRQKTLYTQELKPDLATARVQERSAKYRAAFNLNAQQADALEAEVKKDPENIQAREELMTFYQSNGRKVLGDKITTERFWAHKLWLIEHHPENQAVNRIQPLWDQAAYEQAKKMWLDLLEKKDASRAVLMNASGFFADTDPQFAEKILSRVQAANPKEPMGARFAFLYVRVIEKGGPQPYLQEVRKKLDESRDPLLLSTAGYFLVIKGTQYQGNQVLTEVGKSYLERALQLDPKSDVAKQGLELIRQKQEWDRTPQVVKSPSSEAQYSAVSALPESERFHYLGRLAQDAYIQSNMLEYYKHDETGMKKQWELARKYAEDALRLASKFTGDSNYGNNVYAANMVLGMLAMRQDGDIKRATQYLLTASRTAGTDNNVSYLTTRLPILLLKYGGPDQRKAVIEYLERYGQTIAGRQWDLLHSAQQLRQGIMPAWYQSQVAGLK